MTFRNMLLSAPIGLALVGLLSAQFVLPPPPLVGGGLRYVRITPNSALSISFGAVGFGGRSPAYTGCSDNPSPSQ